MSSVPVLPPELCDHILDCLHDDRSTLRQCALANRDWLPRAQHHLFRSVYVDWANCSALSQLLDSNPTLAYHVATLEIEGALGIFSGDRLHGATLDGWLRAMPDAYSILFTNLSKLELALIPIDADLVRIFRRFVGITHLTLWACPLASFDIFVELFASYPHLKRLSIAFTQEWEVGPRPIARISQGAVVPQLEILELTSDDSIKVLKWLISQDLHHSIHTLSCSRVPWSSLAVFADALSALASTLRNLNIDFGDQQGVSDDMPGVPWKQPVFTPLSGLTHLTLDVHTGRLAAVPYTLFLLSHLPSPALRQITFAIKCSEYDITFPVPWQRIAEATARVVRISPIERVLVTAKERGESAEGIPFSGPANRGLAPSDFAEMEQAVTTTFAAHGLEKLVTFVQRES